MGVSCIVYGNKNIQHFIGPLYFFHLYLITILRKSLNNKLLKIVKLRSLSLKCKIMLRKE